MRNAVGKRWSAIAALMMGFALATGQITATSEETLTANGKQFERAVAASQRLMHAWLKAADPRTLLLPDRLDGEARIYNPHNSGADLYPYLILTAQLTDPDLLDGRLMEMLRNEVRYTSARASVPGSLDLRTGILGPPSLFGAGEYAKDGLIAVTEYMGRSPWFARMVDLMIDAMDQAAVPSAFGKLPAADAELNGDFLQSLVRLYTMTGDPRFLTWSRRIGDAYVREVLPGSFGVPAMTWNFETHTGERRLRLRDHGNETVVGLVMLLTLEKELGSARFDEYRPVLQRMLDRILASANADGMLYNEVDPETLKPRDTALSDNWGYVYGAVYTFYQVTGETKYRDAVRTVLASLPKYQAHNWEPHPGDPTLPLGSFDGYADTIESALYLVNREPVPAALAWIESETARMLAMQRPDGHLEDWYGEGNFNRTLLIYALMKSQGVMPAERAPGLQLGAVRDGEALLLHVAGASAVKLQFDFARHRRVINLAKNYVRLNEFPEWFTVEPNWLYRITGGGAPARIRLGSELMMGERFEAGDWRIEPVGPPPYGTRPISP